MKTRSRRKRDRKKRASTKEERDEQKRLRREKARKKEQEAMIDTDWTSPPGDTIQDILEEKEMTQEEFSWLSKLSTEQVQGLLNGSLRITAEIAIRLESVLGPPMVFWLQREIEYREDLRRNKEAK